MNINFPSVDESYIKSMVENGYYSNATEVVRDAVRRMRELNSRRERFLAAVKLGEDDIAAGRTVPYTPDFWKKSDARVRKMLEENSPLNPDILPDPDDT